MDFRTIEGGGDGGKGRRRSDIEKILDIAGILASAEPKDAGQTELIKGMLRKAEASDSHVVPLIEAYLMGLILGAGPNEEREEEE